MTDCEEAYGLIAMTLAFGEALTRCVSGLQSFLCSFEGALVASEGTGECDEVAVSVLLLPVDEVGVRFVTLTILAPLNVCGTNMLLLFAIEYKFKGTIMFDSLFVSNSTACNQVTYIYNKLGEWESARWIFERIKENFFIKKDL